MTNIQESFNNFHTKTIMDVVCGLEIDQCENCKGPFFSMIMNFNTFIKQFGMVPQHKTGDNNVDYVFDKNFNYIEEDYKKVRDEMKNMLETQTPKDRDKAVHAFEEFNNAYNSLCEAFGFESDASND